MSTAAPGQPVALAREASTRWWTTRGFALFAVLVSALPLLWASLPPLIDLPAHMARYRVMLGDDPALAAFYSFEWKLVGYLGVDLIVLGLAPLMGLEPAVKLVAIAIPALTAAGILWLSHEAHGRIQPLALFALPLAFNTYVQFGFVNYVLGMALALCGFALWLRMNASPRRALVFVGVTALVWTTHMFAWVALTAMIGSAQIALRRSEGRGWVHAIWHAGLDALPLAPPLLMLFVWQPAGSEAAGGWLAGAAAKPGWLFTVLRDRWSWLDAGSIAVFAFLLYYCARSGQWRAASPIVGAALGLFAVFLVLPFGAAYADARFAPYVVLLVLLSPAAVSVPARTLGLIAAAGLAFFGLRTAATTVSFAMQSREVDARLIALDHLPHGARVANFAVIGCEPAWRMHRLGHLASMAVVRRGAFTNDQFDLGPTALMRIKPVGLGAFGQDPSQMVLARDCGDRRGLLTLAQSLAQFPRDRFDYLWVFDAVPVDRALTTGLAVVWTDGRDVLYQLPPVSPALTSER